MELTKVKHTTSSRWLWIISTKSSSAGLTLPILLLHENVHLIYYLSIWPVLIQIHYMSPNFLIHYRTHSFCKSLVCQFTKEKVSYFPERLGQEGCVWIHSFCTTWARSKSSIGHLGKGRKTTKNNNNNKTNVIWRITSEAFALMNSVSSMD